MKPRKFYGFSPRETLVFSSINPVCLTVVHLCNIPYANNGQKNTIGDLHMSFENITRYKHVHAWDKGYKSWN